MITSRNNNQLRFSSRRFVSPFSYAAYNTPSENPRLCHSRWRQATTTSAAAAGVTTIILLYVLKNAHRELFLFSVFFFFYILFLICAVHRQVGFLLLGVYDKLPRDDHSITTPMSITHNTHGRSIIMIVINTALLYGVLLAWYARVQHIRRRHDRSIHIFFPLSYCYYHSFFFVTLYKM